MVLALIELVNPMWAWALMAAVGAPLLAHLLSRGGGRITGFPAVRFVQRAAADTARMLRPRHWLLMVLRVLALAAIVGAFTRPVWYGHVIASPGREGWAIAIIVDRSASMQRTSGGATLFDEAKRRAAELIGRLESSRDVVTVVLLDDAPATLLPTPTANFALLLDRLHAAEPTWTRGDAAAAVALARAQLQHTGDSRVAPARQRRIEIFSDMQATQWQPAADRLRPLDGIWATTHAIGGDDHNVALFSPSWSPVPAIVGQPTQIRVSVGNFTPTPQVATVIMRHEGQLQRQPVQVDPFATGVAVFGVVPGATGEMAPTFEIESPSGTWRADDRTGLFVAVEAARTVTLVTRASVDDPGTAVYFVSRALQAEGSGVALRVQQPGEAIDPQTHAVVIVEAGPLQPSEMASPGRTLIHVVDSSDAAATVAGNRWVEDDRTPIVAVRVESPVLNVFEGPTIEPLLRATFRRRVVAPSLPGEPLIVFEDGSPLLTCEQTDLGVHVRLAADLSPRSTDFAKGPAFAPLLHQLIRGFAVRSSPANPTPRIGDARDTSPGPIDSPTGRMWVELDAAESDLRTIEGRPPRSAAVDAADEQDGAAGRRALELWPMLVALAAACLIIEPLVTSWRRGGRRDV